MTPDLYLIWGFLCLGGFKDVDVGLKSSLSSLDTKYAGGNLGISSRRYVNYYSIIHVCPWWLVEWMIVQSSKATSAQSTLTRRSAPQLLHFKVHSGPSLPHVGRALACLCV